MMYSNTMAFAIKSNGKVLREIKDTVFLPFGQEYSIFIKNMNTVRAQVSITIDGTEATEGSHIIVNANSEVELTRFVKNGNLHSGNRFKFIERTAGVEQHRGVGVEDGLIRIEFEFEKAKPKFRDLAQEVDELKREFDRNKPWPQWQPTVPSPYWNSVLYKGSGGDKNVLRSRSVASGSIAQGMSTQSINANYSVPAHDSVPCSDTMYTTSASSTCDAFYDAGVTVPGSVSNQQFSVVYDFVPSGEPFVMVMKLLGEDPNGKQVEKPVTVKARPTCITCGRVNKATASYCTDCGTSLTIV